MHRKIKPRRSGAIFFVHLKEKRDGSQRGNLNDCKNSYSKNNGALTFANINYPVCHTLPGFVKKGLAELTPGFENYSLKKLAANSFLPDSGLDVNNTGTGESNIYPGSYVFMRYLDSTIENTADKSVQTFKGNDVIAKIAASTMNDDGKAVGTFTKSGLSGGSVIFNSVSKNSKLK